MNESASKPWKTHVLLTWMLFFSQKTRALKWQKKTDEACFKSQQMFTLSYCMWFAVLVGDLGGLFFERTSHWCLSFWRVGPSCGWHLKKMNSHPCRFICHHISWSWLKLIDTVFWCGKVVNYFPRSLVVQDCKSWVYFKTLYKSFHPHQDFTNGHTERYASFICCVRRHEKKMFNRRFL